jgi:alpha-tubulin suppressor-like RCC1 family protein
MNNNIAIKKDEVYVINKKNLFMYKKNKFTLIPKIKKFSWVSVASNNTTVFALNTNGDLYVWGNNWLGVFTTEQPNYDLTIPYNKPYLINKIDNSKWVSINVSRRLVAAINANNDLFLWNSDNNNYGETGEGTNSKVSVKTIKINNKTFKTNTVPIKKINRMNNKKWTSVSLGDIHTCAINEDGQLYAWGYGDENVLGKPITTTISVESHYNHNNSTIIIETNKIIKSTKGHPPVEVPKQDNSDWVKVIAGQNYTYAFNKLGDLYSWGFDSIYGLLGLDSLKSDRSKINKIPLMNNSKWTKLVCYKNHILAINSNSELYAWGGDSYNFYNKLPVNNKVLITKDVVDIAVGEKINCALLKNGKYFIWGEILYDAISKTVAAPSTSNFMNTIEHFTDYYTSCDKKQYWLMCIIIVIIMIIIIYNNCN